MSTFDAKLLVTETWVKVGKDWILLAGHAEDVNNKNLIEIEKPDVGFVDMLAILFENI